MNLIMFALHRTFPCKLTANIGPIRNRQCGESSAGVGLSLTVYICHNEALIEAEELRYNLIASL